MESTITLDDHSLHAFTNLFFTLSRKDNLTLFILSRDGLDSRVSTPEKLGFTKKKYYTRLQQLVKAGLIISGGKRRNLYSHTTLGKLVYENHVAPMMTQIKNIPNLMMIDALQNSNKFSKEQIDQFIAPIFEKLDIQISNPLETKLSFITSAKDVEPTMIRYIQRSQREIIMATRAHVGSVWHHVLSKATFGARVKLLVDKDLQVSIGGKMENTLFDDYTQMQRKSDGISKYLQLQENVTGRTAKVPVDLLMLDREVLLIGLIDRAKIDTFNAVIIIEGDDHICRQIEAFFNTLWDNSEQIPRMNITERSYGNTLNNAV